MKKFIIVFIALVVFFSFMEWTIQSVVWKTPVGKWYFQSETVIEPSFYKGSYLQINDSIRVVMKHTEISGEFYVVQIKVHKDSAYKNTDIITYYSMYDGDKWDVLRDLQSEYDEKSKPHGMFK